MTPGGLVQLAEAPPQGLQLALVPAAPPPPSPASVRRPVPLTSRRCRPVAPKPPVAPVPETPPNSKPLPPTVLFKHVPSPIPFFLPKPPSKVFLAYKDTVRVDPADPPPLRSETLQFDPSLMFVEPQAEVQHWLSGRGGVALPRAGVALPYLPPFVSSLSMLSALLQAKNSLMKSSLQLLSESRPPQTKPRPDNSTEETSSQPPADLPDSTSDLRTAEDQPGKPYLTHLLADLLIPILILG